MTSTAMDEDEFPSLAKVWERLEGEDNHFLGSIDRCSAATLKGLLRAVQRMQFHLQKPCIVRVGSELDFVAFADIQRVLPRITLGTATATMVASNKYDGALCAWGSARLSTETPSESLRIDCKMTVIMRRDAHSEVEVFVDLMARTDSPAVSERFGLWCGEDNMVVKYKSDDLDLPGSIDPTFFDELARLVGIPADHDNQEPVRTALPADTERRVRMATVLAVCILGPATRYDGLRGTAQGNFFDGHKPTAWFHDDPAEEVFAHCLNGWLDDQTFAFAGEVDE